MQGEVISNYDLLGMKVKDSFGKIILLSIELKLKFAKLASEIMG
ncbi:MAG: hypothetical protein PVG90_00345 [Bacillota bacterium]|jgi:hypothetical protein